MVAHLHGKILFADMLASLMPSRRGGRVVQADDMQEIGKYHANGGRQDKRCKQVPEALLRMLAVLALHKSSFFCAMTQLLTVRLDVLQSGRAALIRALSVVAGLVLHKMAYMHRRGRLLLT